LSVGRLLRSLYLLYFSQPFGERALYRAIRARPVRSIVELGIGITGRTRRVLEIASWRPQCSPLRYTGIDLFEGRPSGQPGPSLKEAFAQLRLPGAHIKLVPGDPNTALMRVANALVGTDLLLIAADQDCGSLAQAWAWVPRMLTPHSLVFLEESGSTADQRSWKPLTLADVQKLAAEAGRSLKRAA
jgi:hypothetical protein